MDFDPLVAACRVAQGLDFFQKSSSILARIHQNHPKYSPLSIRIIPNIDPYLSELPQILTPIYQNHPQY